jgi:hypothetical protein
MTMLTSEMVPVQDEELVILAEEKGPASAEAQALAHLKAKRPQVLQVHCFRVGDTYLTSPIPYAMQPVHAPDLIEALARKAER